MNNAGKYSLVAIALLLFLATPVEAQRPTPGPPPIDRKVNADRARQQDMSNREWQLRNFGTQPNKPKDRRQLEALMAQTEEDFNRILTLHNEFARLLSAEKPLDYEFVFEASAEIKKRASRLQSNLALQQLPDDTPIVEKTDEIKETEMKDALVKLCKQIRSFVTNPVIENPSTIDAHHLTNARRELESLIQFSGHLNKAAKKHKQK